MLSRIFVETCWKRKNNPRSTIPKIEQEIYHSVIRDIRDLGGNIFYSHNSEYSIETGDISSTIHFEIDRKDAPTIMKLLKENHSCIVSIKYI